MSAVYDCSKISDLQTSVMAWYTDVMHEVKPITSGYRLALSYNLVHTTQTLRPALAGNDQVFNDIRDVLLAWKAGVGSGVPEKIIYLLDHKYSQANLRGSALKGSDAQKAAILDTLGKQFGFRLGLASIECYLRGAADDPHGGYSERRHGDEMLEFEEVCHTEMSLTNVVDFDGVSVAGQIEMSDATETVPQDLEESMRDEPHDEQEYEGYMGNVSCELRVETISPDFNPQGAGTLERWYRRTALVIWPKFADCIIYSDLEDVCVDLRKEVSKTRSCTPEQRVIIELLLNRRVSQPSDAANVADAVCHAACCWRDLGLWRRAIQLCSTAAGVAAFAAELVCSAIGVFGFDAVQPSLDAVLQYERRNHQLFAFLDEFREALQDRSTATYEGNAPEDQNDAVSAVLTEDLVAVTSNWIEARWYASLNALRIPTREDFSTLSELATRNGGLSYIRDSILPQLVQISDASTLREFALFIAKEWGSVHPADSSLRQETIARILESSIYRLSITFPDSAYPYAYYSHHDSDPSLQLAKSYFETCIVLNCLDQCGALIAKIANTTGQSARDARHRIQLLILPFLVWASEFIARHPNMQDIPGLSALRAVAVEYILDDMATGGITRGEVERLLQIVSLPGCMDMFATSVLPRLNALACSAASAQAILEALKPRLTQLVMPTSYQGPSLLDLMLSMTMTYSQCVSIDTTEAIISGMDFCIQMQALDGVWTIIRRVLDPSKLRERTPVPCSSYCDASPEDSVFYADKVVVPLMSQLRQLGLKHNMFDTFVPAFRQIARAYTQEVLGPFPSGTIDERLAVIRHWSCSCTPCTQVRMFLLSDSKRSITLLKIGAPSRKHVEDNLYRYVTAEGATWSTVRTSSPQGIMVTKTDLLHGRSEWKAHREKAIQLIKDVSPDEAERIRIYGDEYAGYTRWIEGISTFEALALQQQRPAAAGPSTSTASSSR
ncbi:hypothetical protein EIP86_000355 [Pleurotus ostreatoroseus]|nr:hypothetical protein EIP86_000355 [Pleurotus ostreatoroseus]